MPQTDPVAAAPPRGARTPVSNPRKELVREQLIDIAARIFDSKGYAQTSIGDIATAMGLGRSAVYHYFRNKEEILAALVEAEALTPSHQLQELIDAPGLTAAERLRRAVVNGILRRLSSGSRFLALSHLEAQIPKALQGIYNHGRRQIYDFYVRCITEGIRDGEFREVDPKIAAFAVIGMANWTSRWYQPTGSKTPQEIGEIIAEFALQGLRASRTGGEARTALRQSVQALREQVETMEGLLR